MMGVILMKIKVGNKIYDGEKEPVMVILSVADKENIKNMPEDNFKYCCYPDDMEADDILKWMER